MNDVRTGEDLAGSAVSNTSTLIIQNTDVHEARCDLYHPPYQKSGSSLPEATQTTVGSGSKNAIEKAVRHEYLARSLVARTSESAENLVSAARNDDTIQLASAGIELAGCLSQLWKHRQYWEDDWAALLNFLQAAVKVEEFELFSLEQAETIQRLVDNYLSTNNVTSDNVRVARGLLTRVGLDPWSALRAIQTEKAD